MAKFIQYMTRASLYDGPFDDQVGWTAAGMGDVVVTETGKLIVIDGGFPDDAADFVELLETQNCGKTPEVDFWIITHPHLDHYGVIKEISENRTLKNRVAVKKIVYLFPEEFLGKNGLYNALSKVNNEMAEICRLMNAQPYTPKRNEIFELDDIQLEFLYVPDDCSVLNTAGGNSNLCSLIFAIKGKNKRVMVTGDAYGRSMQITAWRYAEKLKCDILQMPHHALCDAYCVDFTALSVRKRFLCLYRQPDIVLCIQTFTTKVKVEWQIYVLRPRQKLFTKLSRVRQRYPFDFRKSFVVGFVERIEDLCYNEFTK